jgi:hypothetical protein
MSRRERGLHESTRREKMFKNFKPILIGILTGGVLIAMGARAYNVFASPAASTHQYVE